MPHVSQDAYKRAGSALLAALHAQLVHAVQPFGEPGFQVAVGNHILEELGGKAKQCQQSRADRKDYVGCAASEVEAHTTTRKDRA